MKKGDIIEPNGKFKQSNNVMLSNIKRAKIISERGDSFINIIVISTKDNKDYIRVRVRSDYYDSYSTDYKHITNHFSVKKEAFKLIVTEDNYSIF